MNKSDDWDKKERDLDKYDSNLGSHNEKVKILIDKVIRLEREFKYQELRIKQLESDSAFIAGKVVQILKTLEANGIKV